MRIESCNQPLSLGRALCNCTCSCAGTDGYAASRSDVSWARARIAWWVRFVQGWLGCKQAVTPAVLVVTTGCPRTGAYTLHVHASRVCEGQLRLIVTVRAVLASCIGRIAKYSSPA